MWRGDANKPYAAAVELPQFVPVTALYVGRYPSTNHADLFLWVSRSEEQPKRLVMVVVQDKSRPQPAQTLRRYKWAMANSPFFAPFCEQKSSLPFRGVCTFEIALGDIVGMDYCNPLIVDASRVVIEATRVNRRWFPSLRECSNHYGWDEPQEEVGGKRDDGSPPCGPVSCATLVSELYRPRAHADGGSPTLPHMVPRSEYCRAPSSPSMKERINVQAYWREHAEERRYEMLNKVFLTAERVLRFQRLPPVPDEVTPTLLDFDEECDALEEVLRNQTVNFRFDDPFLPYVLREVIHDPDHTHLLRLCEAGLPSWAIFLPQYTGLYRRSMRIVISGIILMISCFSMLLGFYDLYKHFPQVRVLMKKMLGPMSSRFEDLVLVRFSVLLAWILPYQSIFRRCGQGLVLFYDLVRHAVGDFLWLATTSGSAVLDVVGPVLSALGEPLRGLGWIFSACRSTLWAASTFVGSLAQGRTDAVVTTASLLRAEFKILRGAGMSIYHGTCYLGVKVAKHQASLYMSLSRLGMKCRRGSVAFARRRPLRAVALVFALVLLRLKGGNLRELARGALSAREKVLEGLCEQAPAADGELAPRGRLAAWLCRDASGSPEVTEIALICGRGLQRPCWRRGGGSRRCRCKYEAVEGLNVSSPHPRGLVVGLPPRRHANGSVLELRLPCVPPSGARGHCIVAASALLAAVDGAAEVWAFRAPHAAPSAAAYAGFVIEAPRQRAEPPSRVRACLEAGGPPWSLVLPSCQTWEASTEAPAGSALVKASWVRAPLGSCQLADWEVTVEVEGESALQLCVGEGPGATSCVGALPDAAAAALLADVQERRSWRSSRARAKGRGSARAFVAARCVDAADNPPQVGRSPRYRPPAEPSREDVRMLPPGRALCLGLGPALFAAGARQPAWQWAMAWWSEVPRALGRALGALLPPLRHEALPQPPA